ncbi:MAG TPA: hypothetical protein VMU34_24420 [Mycobacterium sp.]|nr:hypothetical protein [Mycobacterium sp.]
MSAVAVMLIAMGAADACRRMFRPGWLPVIVGPAVVVLVAALSGLWHRGDIALLAIAALATVAWEWLSVRSERSGKQHAAPLLVFTATLVVLIVLSGWGSRAGGVVERWIQWSGLPLAHVEAARLLMVVGAVLLQLVTGNQLVRLVLGSVGAVKPEGQPQPSDRLKGGRLLGPMERLLILGLGLAGQVTAATAVVAAKSIIRFPEINAQKGRANGDIGIDDVTEYFLLGSFASWLLALIGLALALSQ